jgi:hypothetical protein
MFIFPRPWALPDQLRSCEMKLTTLKMVLIEYFAEFDDALSIVENKGLINFIQGVQVEVIAAKQ